MYGTIYKITCKVNNKIYIGKTTKSLEERFKSHYRTSLRPRNYTSYLYNAINKYGIDNFEICEIDHASSEQELDERERYWIKVTNSQNASIGYNIQGAARAVLSEVISFLLPKNNLLLLNTEDTYQAVMYIKDNCLIDELGVMCRKKQEKN